MSMKTATVYNPGTDDKSSTIYEALCRAQQKITKAKKDGTNPHFRSHYTTLASVQDACLEALNHEGIAVSQTLETVGEKSYLVTSLLYGNGSSIVSSCPLLMAKSDMQDLGSAISYARRYSLAAICGVVQDDDDGNVASEPGGDDEYQDYYSKTEKTPKKAAAYEENRKITEGQAKLFHVKTRGMSLDQTQQIFKEFKVGTEIDLPMASFNKVLERIEEMRKL